MLATTLQDLKYAFRSLTRKPGATLAILMTLALGIGANSTLFSIVDTVLLKPLPYVEPDQLVMFFGRYGSGRTAISPPDYMDRKEQSELLLGIAAYTFNQGRNLSGQGSNDPVEVSRVTASFFDVLGVEPVLGRALLPGETSAQGDRRVAVLSHGLWQRSFGSDPGVVGREILLHGETHVVVAVMPPGLDLPRSVDLWTPLVFPPNQLSDTFRGNEFLYSLGRVKAGVTAEQIRAEMEAIAARVIERVPARAEFLRNNGWGAATVPLVDEVVGSVRPTLWTLLATVGVVLLIACANVASLLLAKTAQRTRELAVRSSLGASRTRLWRQLLTESLVLAGAGGGLGLGLAQLTLRFLPGFIPHNVPRLEQVALDARVVLFTAALTLICGVVFGTAPAWQGSASRLRGFLHPGMASHGGRRLRRLLVISEVALALVLLIGAGLLLRSWNVLTAVDPGFDGEGRLSLRLSLPPSDFPQPQDVYNFQHALGERLGAIPGVTSVSFSDRVPLDGNEGTSTFHVAGYAPAPGEPSPGGDIAVVGPDYFATLGIPVLDGRGFSDAERSRVAVIDAWTAERFWPGRSAVGQKIHFRSNPAPEFLYEIVGVVGHVQQQSLDEKGRFQIYLSALQFPVNDAVYSLRTAGGEPEQLIGQIRAGVGELAPALAVDAIRTLDALVGNAVALPHFNLVMVGSFACLALLLAAVGLYGVLAQSVSQRTAEIGMRIALGASGASILRLVLREGLALVGAGLAAGIVGAFALTRLMSHLLYGVKPTDPATFVGLSAVLVVVAAMAALLPARRAARLDPVTALRSE